MEELYNLKYKDWGDKYLAEFWTTWKETVRKCGELLGIESMTCQLVRQLQSSVILKDDIKALRAKSVVDWDYDQIAQSIHQRLEDIAFEQRTEEQMLEHEQRLAKGKGGKGDRGGGGGGGGWPGSKGGAKAATTMTDAQKKNQARGG